MSAKPLNLKEPLTFILAEDNPDHVELALMALQDLHELTKIHIATTGERVITYLEVLDKLPDVILLDIKMPLMNGIEVLQEMKQNESWSKIPVIMISTSTNPKDVDACKALGAISYITKPYSDTDLIQALENI